MIERWLRKKFPYILLTPLLVVMVSITILPTIYLFSLSLSEMSVRTGFQMRFIGMENYINLFMSPRFLNSLKVTAIFTGGSVSIQLLIGLGLALLLNREDLVLRKLFIMLIVIPMLMTPVVIGLTWRILYDPSFGLFNYFIGLLGLRTEAYLARPTTALIAVMITDIWEWTPFLFLMMFAGLQSLPQDVFEVAHVEGASGIQTFWYITLPMLRQIILIALLLRVIDSIKTFDVIFMMTHGGPGTATENINLFSFIQMFQNLFFGYGATSAIVLLFIVIGITMIFIRVIGRQFTEV